MATTAIGVGVAGVFILAISSKARKAVGNLFGGKGKGLSGVKRKRKALKGNYSKQPKRYNYKKLRA